MDVTERFSNRVNDYVRYRPTYPRQLLTLLRAHGSLADNMCIADVGSGTGILSQLLLADGHRVCGIEPNREMREAAEQLLGDKADFVSVDTAAEKTGLPDASVDLVTAGQAFHWFDRERAMAEFKRILKPHGWVVLVWNDRCADGTPFLQAYETLLKTCGDYNKVNHRQIGAAEIRPYMAEGRVEELCCDNHQDFDYAGFEGRARSSSYVPSEGQEWQRVQERLKAIFTEHQESGQVRFDYVTRAFVGRPG